jgi:hypothetical protein
LEAPTVSTTDLNQTPTGDQDDASLRLIRGAAFALDLIRGIAEQSPDVFVVRRRARVAADICDELARDHAGVAGPILEELRRRVDRSLVVTSNRWEQRQARLKNH